MKRRKRTLLWNDFTRRNPALEKPERGAEPHFQDYQFDKSLDYKSIDVPDNLRGLSPAVHGLVHGDKTLRTKIGRLLDGVFTAAAFRVR